MPTYNNKPYASVRNLNLKQGLIRFGRTYTSNPLPTDVNGLYVNSNNLLVYSKLGVDLVLSTNP